MKKNFVFLVILAIVLVFGLIVTACGDGSGDNGNGNGNNGTTIITTNGRLTITGLSAYDGKYIYASRPGGVGDLLDLEGFGSDLQFSNGIIDQSSKKRGLITNGSATLKVYNTHSRTSSEHYNYTGNHQNVKFTLYVSTSENFDGSTSSVSGSVTVNFSNGIGSGTYDTQW
jgi:hypothetical protein